MSSEQPHIKDHLLKFGETVSVKGVSRIIKSKSKRLRVLWFIAVVASLCILLWQLSTVFMKYFTWPVDSAIEESVDPPLFPDVTFCNTYPAQAFKKFDSKLSMKDFLFLSDKQITKLAPAVEEIWNYANLTEDIYQQLSMYFLSKTA